MCRFVAKFMAMSMDEKAAQLISRSVEGRLLMWPDRKSSTSQDSNFDPMHAHLIAVGLLTFHPVLSTEQQSAYSMILESFFPSCCA